MPQSRATRRISSRRPRTGERTRLGAPDVGDSSNRQRLLDAAVACIAEEGYYRASSNHIARRAGVTWGVIQHHFGTREQLLLEVARDRAAGLVATIESATIVGDTERARLESLADVVWSYYCRPEFLVGAQIVMNLSRDSTTAAETVRALDEISQRMNAGWQHLVDQVVAPARQPDGFRMALLYILRGAAVGEALLDAMARRPPSGVRAGYERERDLLLTALLALLPADRDR
jgi:AcrR family transcriptional regulator